MIKISALSPDQIYTLKMANGEEIVARITEVNTDAILLHRPLTVVPGPQGLQMMQALFTASPDHDIILNPASVMMCAPARDQIRDSYIEATTGIQPVRGSGILMG